MPCFRKSEGKAFLLAAYLLGDSRRYSTGYATGFSSPCFGREEKVTRFISSWSNQCGDWVLRRSFALPLSSLVADGFPGTKGETGTLHSLLCSIGVQIPYLPQVYMKKNQAGKYPDYDKRKGESDEYKDSCICFYKRWCW